VEVLGVALLIVTVVGLKEQVGAGVPPLIIPHEMLTLPV
jgi:hypothetical protein